MNLIVKLSIILLLIAPLSCSKKIEIEEIKEVSVDLQMKEAYEEGMRQLNEGQSLIAVKKFNEAELLFPQSDWAPTAALMTAYVYYADDYYSDAIYHVERYLKVYPNHKDKSYGHYLLALCYYENIVDEKRDLEPLLKAKNEFEFIIKNYPNSEFASDAFFKIDLIVDRLAGKEMYIGRHYAKSKKWIAAINRFKIVLDKYETSVYVEEAIHRLAEIHYIIGLEDEAKKYAGLLGYNYGSGNWYKATYQIFNKEYEFNEKKVFSEKKKNKETLLKRFKIRFKNLFN